MSDRLSRQEIKRDEFVEALERSASFMERNARFLIAGAVALVVVLAAAYGIYWWMESREVKAEKALAEAMEVYRAPIGAVPEGSDYDGPTFDDEGARRTRASERFSAVQEDFGSTDAADVAIVFLAQIASEEGNLERARNLWQGFLDEYDDHVLAGQVRVNLIHLDRDQGRSEELVGELETMLAAAPEDRELPGDVVLWELAATYEALGQDDQARSTYQRLAEEYPTSSYAALARQKVPGAAGAGGPGGLNPGSIPVG